MNIDVVDTRRFVIYRLKWLGLYVGIGLILGFRNAIFPMTLFLSLVFLFCLTSLGPGS